MECLTLSSVAPKYRFKSAGGGENLPLTERAIFAVKIVISYLLDFLHGTRYGYQLSRNCLIDDMNFLHKVKHLDCFQMKNKTTAGKNALDMFKYLLMSAFIPFHI